MNKKIEVPSVAKAPNRGLLIAVAILILGGLIWTGVNTKHYQDPFVQWVVVIIASIGFAYIGLRTAYDAEEKPIGGVLVKFGLATLLFFVLVGVVGSSARQNRVSGVPKEALIHYNGYIPNPDAYIEFHKKVEDGSNKIDFDKETEDFIRNNHGLPTWIVINGYTRDLTGWKQAHPDATVFPKTAG